MSGVSKEEYIAATTYIINMLSKFAITTNQIYYDTRFDSECVLGCKPMFSEINTTIASAIALINLHEDVQDSFDDYFAMISNNVGIYVETLANHVENYTDNLVLYMLDDSVGSVIDNYIKYYNDLHDNLLELFDPYMSFESKEMIMNIRQARNNVDDNDNLNLQ